MNEGGLLKNGNSKDSTQREPMVSIITVVFNGVNGLEETIVSIKSHKTRNIEYIIIDGGSTDRTVELIKKNESVVDYWSSEPDNGIYDALNKGIKIARGHFFYVLNVGDKLLQFPGAELNEAIKKDADVVLFNVLLSDGRIIKSQIDYRTRFGNTIHHQGAFYKRSLNIVYDVAFKVYSDFDINQKLFLKRRKFISFDKVISRHSLDGVSNDRKNRSEYFAVIRKNVGLIWVIIGYMYITQGELRNAIKKWLGVK